jgi:RNA polymerase sigma-70 factor (ECF subfamily)
MKETKTISIQELVKKAQSGDKDAFGLLYDRYMDQIYRFVYYRVGTRVDAEDITEHIFLTAFKGLINYVDRGVPFEAWLYRIARNAVIDHYRAKKHSVCLDSALFVEDGKKTPEQKTEDTIMYELTMQFIHALPDAYQEILLLYYVSDLDTKTISMMIKKPVDQVRVLKQRALSALKKRMKKHI